MGKQLEERKKSVEQKTEKRRKTEAQKSHHKKTGGRKRKKKTGRRRKMLRVLAACAAGIGAVSLILVWAVSVLRAAGKEQLIQDSVGSAAEMRMHEYEPSGAAAGTDGQEALEAAGADGEEKEGRVYYRGKSYDFNEDIMTFLVMGIDQRSETVQEQTEGFDGGSADVIFLVVLNPHTKKMKIIAIDRNTMADVDLYDYYGEYEKTVRTQICVQHGFGDGTVKSAQYMEKAVSNLLYGLPINGYCAVNMSAIGKVNDAVGGVDVVVSDDMTRLDGTMTAGETIHLTGEQALNYVRMRDTSQFGSAAKRLERQKQYVSAFIAKAKANLKKDPTLPVTLFQELQPYMTTDLNVEKVAYLAGMAADFDFGATDIQKIEGETVMGEVYEEFYVDETAMFELVLHTFYEEVY